MRYHAAMFLLEENGIAFLKGFLERFGNWGLTLVCLLPALAFCAYVKWDDHRQVKSHAPHGGASHDH